jgi:hypothetical protein
MYLVSGSLSGIWLNTQQVRGLASLAWSCSRSTDSDEDGSDKDSGDKEVEYSEKESWEDIVVKVE